MGQLIGLDIDDVLGDFVGSLVTEVNIHFGTQYKREDITPYYKQWRRLFGAEGEEWIWSMFDDEKFVLNIEPTPGAVEGIQQLRRMGVDLVVITSRLRSPWEYTLRWLDRHFPPGSFMAIERAHPFGGNGQRTKPFLCKTLGVSLFVDDMPENVKELQSVGVPTLLYDQPWNNHVLPSPMVRRVYTWNEMVDYIRQHR